MAVTILGPFPAPGSPLRIRATNRMRAASTKGAIEAVKEAALQASWSASRHER